MTTEMLARCFASTRAILENVTPDQYDRPTPCASWNTRALVNHIVEGANWFGLCVEAGTSPDPDPTRGVDYASGDVLASYDEGVARSLAAFSAPGAQERLIKLPFGEMPGAAFMLIATDDVFVHGWDLATATGQPADLDPEVATQLLAAMRDVVSDAFRGPDGEAPFGAPVAAPAGASPASQLAAFLGRNP